MNKRTETNLDELKKMVILTFRELAEDAYAVYRVKRRALVNLEKMDKFMEIFQEEF